MKRSLRICLGFVLCLPAPVYAQQGAGNANLGTAGNAQTLVGKPVSVAQLERILILYEKKRDSAAATELFGLRLTERLSSPRLASMTAALPGHKAREALVALADQSAFLRPPEAEIPAKPAPDFTEARRIVSLMLDYLGRTIQKLPNFYATRTTVHYDDTGKDPTGVPLNSGEPLHWNGVTSATVVYDDGKEIADAGLLKPKQPDPEEMGLVTKGTFGPILLTVIGDGARSQMTFSRWEQGTDGPAAVFRVAVPKDKSHYQVTYRSPSQTQPAEQPTSYHGEVSIDPATGTILRVTVQADFEPGADMVRAGIVVEYGPVDIGAKNYICPVRSVSLSQGRAKTPVGVPPGTVSVPGPEITRLNDVTFGNYHVFRAEVRVLTEDDAAPNEKP